MSGLATSIRLTLKDAFSKAIPKASKAAETFGKNVSKVSSLANEALSSVAGSFASLGVAIGAAAAISKTIEFEDRLVRMGTIAGASSAEIKELKKNIFDIATLPGIKVGEDEMVSAQEVIMTKTGNWDFIQKNLENIGRIIQGMDVGGEAAGGILAEFDKLKYSSKEVTEALDVMYTQGNMGSFTGAHFAQNGAALISAYSRIGTTTDDIKKLGAAMQILTYGTDEVAAVTIFENIMSELADPSKQEALKKMGIHVRDIETGQFRDLVEILPEIVKKGEEFGNLDIFGAIFGGTAMEAINAFKLHGGELEKFLEMGNTTGALMDASAENAASLASNLENLQTLFMSVANTGLEKPLQLINDLLNDMAKNPWAIKATFGVIAAGIGAVAVASGVSTFLSIANGIKSLKGGKMPSLPGSGGGGTGMPVFVTNMGGAGLGVGTNGQGSGSSSKGKANKKKGGINRRNSPASQNPRSPKVPAVKAPAVPSTKAPVIPNTKMPVVQKPNVPRGVKPSSSSMAGGGWLSAIFAAVQLKGDLDAIEDTEGLTSKEEGRAKGEVIGGTAATLASLGIVTVAAAKGAVLGSFIPVVGTAIGGILGALVGAAGVHFANKAGQELGGMIGESFAKDDMPKSIQDTTFPKNDSITQQLSALEKRMAEQNQTAPQSSLKTDVTFTDQRTIITQSYGNAHVSKSFSNGNAREARSMMQ